MVREAIASSSSHPLSFKRRASRSGTECSHKTEVDSIPEANFSDPASGPGSGISTFDSSSDPDFNDDHNSDDGKDGRKTDSSDSEETPEELSSDEDVQQQRALKADITPHHRAEKRPQRRTAAKASEAWRDLSNYKLSRRNEMMMVEGPPRGSEDERRPHKNVQRSLPDVEVVAETPKKRIRAANQALTPENKLKATGTDVNDAGNHSPTKDKFATPRQRKKAAKEADSTIKARTKKTRALALNGQDNIEERFFIRPTSSDAYFANHAPRSKKRSSKHQTSDAVLSGQMSAISSKSITRLSTSIAHELQNKAGTSSSGIHGASQYEACYDHWWSLLACTGRPLLFYGVGSKQAHLNQFARYLAREGHCACVVVRGESGGRIEDVLRELERITGTTAPSTEQRRLFSNPLEARATKLIGSISEGKDAAAIDLLVVIHNFDAQALLQERSIHTLAILSSCSKIHLCVDTGHVNSGLLAHLHAETEQPLLPWLWININTYVPVLEELLNERGPSVSRSIGLPRVLDVRAAGAGGLDVAATEEYDQGNESTFNGHRILSERSAVHILRSVTGKAKKLFLLLAKNTLEGKDRVTMSHASLAKEAGRNYIAHTPEALRSLLVEFTSHGLIRIEGPASQSQFDGLEQSQGLLHAGEEAQVSIAMSSNHLRRVIDEMQAGN